MKQPNPYQKANDRINLLVGIKKTTNRNTIRTNEFKVNTIKNKTMENYIFEEWTIEDFNHLLSDENHITKDDNFGIFGDKVEDDSLQYFYMSMDKEDVIEAIENEKDIADMLNLSLICIRELGYYIATY